tara:strand:- start:1305 stop:1949 length:645 start_codon:yes stop_codon:yes gene_type:complete
MKFITSILIFLLVFSVSVAIGQEVNKEKTKTVFAAKLYAVSTFHLGSVVLGNGLEISKSFSPTISWGKEYGNYNEVEVTDFSFVKNAFQNRFNVGSRYSYNWRLFSKSETARFSFYIGAGAGAYFNREKGLYPYVVELENFKRKQFDTYASVIPRINFKLGKRAYLDVSVPYNFFKYRWESNQFLPNQDYNNKTNYEAAFPNKFTVNVGVAIKF